MPAPSDMTGKTAIVTGAAAGLGRASALRLAQAGAAVALVAAGLEETAATIRAGGGTCHVHPCDLSNRAALAQVVPAAVAALGRLDALCNVAGVMLPGATAELSDESWDLTMAVNLTAPTFLIRDALPHLLETKGAIVNVTSCAAFKGQAYFAAYCAAKAGLTHMTKALAMEFMHKGIRINAVAPGGMMTGLVGNMRLLPADADRSLLDRIASPRGLVEVDEVAEMVAYLASDAASGWHGSCVNLDAGITAG
jgi:NAD(P)-dependent dehydrogenase (short-subunit alcohol dehydrogenase family)